MVLHPVGPRIWLLRALPEDAETSRREVITARAVVIVLEKTCCWRHTALLSLFQNRSAFLSRFIVFHRPRCVSKCPIITFWLWFGDVLQKRNHRIDIWYMYIVQTLRIIASYRRRICHRMWLIWNHYSGSAVPRRSLFLSKTWNLTYSERMLSELVEMLRFIAFYWREW